MKLYGKGKIYDLKKLANHGWFIHTPCAVRDIRENERDVSLITDGWVDKPYYILISNIEAAPSEVMVRRLANGSCQSSGFEPAENEFHGPDNFMVIRLRGRSEVQIRL